jgi:hypothetical protein
MLSQQIQLPADFKLNVRVLHLYHKESLNPLSLSSCRAFKPLSCASSVFLSSITKLTLNDKRAKN